MTVEPGIVTFVGLDTLTPGRTFALPPGGVYDGEWIVCQPDGPDPAFRVATRLTDGLSIGHPVGTQVVETHRKVVDA